MAVRIRAYGGTDSGVWRCGLARMAVLIGAYGGASRWRRTRQSWRSESGRLTASLPTSTTWRYEQRFVRLFSFAVSVSFFYRWPLRRREWRAYQEADSPLDR
eukprot:3254888-Rhodomonas_salina.1